MSSAAEPPREIDTTMPHSARVWNYWLGGKDNFAVDRSAGDMVWQVLPGIVDVARYSRAFLGRAVRYLAGEAGIRQFLDVGTGLPTADNTHEIVQRVAPDARVVYVDNDSMVLAHARALLTNTGTTSYIDADLHEPEAIVRAADANLDLGRPVGLILNGVMGHVGEDEEAVSIVRRLLAPLASGSYLSLSDGTGTSPEAVESQRQYNESGAVPYHLRSLEQIARFFDGLELVEPGVVRYTEWRPDPDTGPPAYVDGYGGVARKP